MSLKKYAINGMVVGGLITLLPISLTLMNGGYGIVNEPLRLVPQLLDIIAYRLDEGKNKRHFIDERPFGSLDAVIIIRKGERVEIRSDNPQFKDQEKTYLAHIKILY
ncbi:hypothetical protein J4440_05715 [Candidatus Woesearchaeota archaeon]|nr:hypothetical protein [Candidatus Woesearchaeota archaeon]